MSKILNRLHFFFPSFFVSRPLFRVLTIRNIESNFHSPTPQIQRDITFVTKKKCVLPVQLVSPGCTVTSIVRHRYAWAGAALCAQHRERHTVGHKRKIAPCDFSRHLNLPLFETCVQGHHLPCNCSFRFSVGGEMMEFVMLEEYFILKWCFFNKQASYYSATHPANRVTWF